MAQTSTSSASKLHEGQFGFTKFLPRLERDFGLFNFTFRQCNLSVLALRELAESSSPTIDSITCCFLYALFEGALGDHHGLRQLKIANGLFEEHRSSVKSNVLSEEDDMILTYLGPMLASFTMSLGEASEAHLKEVHKLDTNLILKDYFLSLSEAQRYLNELLDGIFPLGDSLGVTNLPDHETADDLLEGWSCRLADLMAIPSQGTTPSLRRATLLRLRYCMAKISLGTQFYLDESRYDKYTDTFAEIVHLSREILYLEFILLGDRALEPIITFEDMIIQPLFLTACRCRDPIIRRTALNVLESVDRTEAPLGSKIAAYVGAAVVEIEEDGILNVQSCRGVPAQNRIRLQDIYYDPGDLADPTVSRQSVEVLPSYTLLWRSRPVELFNGQFSQKVVLKHANDSWAQLGTSPWRTTPILQFRGRKYVFAQLS
ncbi:hypothetical protein H2200_005037 [Cladophialophora chaetospira]|uniref:Uncharacterized protein n=1 Tax=Cladophialophora chaetospira TaxID=386627 RepID=A0AA39CJ90_9EURO|nr:hypothetical protein H2200_005037 [Cladophialophora chaetospira]